MERGIPRFSPRHVVFGFRAFIRRKLHPDWPWWPQDAVRLCASLLKKTDAVFEFGSGRSTLWLAERAERVVSVEHVKAWFDQVKQMTARRSNVDLRFTPLEKAIDPNDEPYIRALRAFPADSFDMALIDGKLRGHAALAALEKLRSGGFIVVDDSNRYFSAPINPDPATNDFEMLPEWKSFCEQTRDWRRVWTADGIHFTAFFIKP